MYLEEQEHVPYLALNYVVAAANYGGRVTDDKDVVLISAMLKRCFCPEVMNDSYRLSKLDTYSAPTEGPLADTRNYIEGLPLNEDPEVFGLHPNANIAYELKMVGDFTETILMMQPRVAGAAGAKTPDELAQDLCRDIAGKVPAILDTEKAHSSTFANVDGKMGSLGVFLGQEVSRFNELLKVMKSSLILLDKAIEGTVVMSADLESMASKFLDNKVPLAWEKAGYPSLKPLSSWVMDLIKRVEFVSDWLYKGAPNTYWVPAFYFPQGFMTAALQSYARKTATPIDALQFKTNVKEYYSDEVKEAPEDGVNIHGLYIQGAKWDFGKKCLEDNDPKVPIVPFPVVMLEPVDEAESLTGGCYSCPLYKTSTRRGELSTTGHSTNFVLYSHVPSERPSD